MRLTLHDPWALVDAVQRGERVVIGVAPPAPAEVEAQQRTLLLYLTARTIDTDVRVHILRPRGEAPGLEARVQAAVEGLTALTAARGLDLEIR